jgi:DNA-binding LacI/PurR family transcriptional regulator
VLSSIRQPVPELAARAVAELEILIQNEKENKKSEAIARIFLPVHFQKGKTTQEEAKYVTIEK